MNPLLIGPVFELGKTIIDRFFPDKEKAAEAERELWLMAARGELAGSLAQIEVNAKEAQHASIFVAGWRPFIGWCCGVGFLWATIGQPVFSWIGAAKGWPPAPTIDNEVLMTTLFGMLGLGGLRTVEKIKGATK